MSYLAAMGEDRVALSVHYENYAFLRLGNVTNLEKPALLVVTLIVKKQCCGSVAFFIAVLQVNDENCRIRIRIL